MSKAHVVLKALRSLHLYIGLFIAPSVLFFAFTGALQTFSLHETTQGRNYKPPTWIAVLAQIHKKQTTMIPVRKSRPTTLEDPAVHTSHGGKQADPLPQRPETKAPATQDGNSLSHLPLKIFFLLVAVGLFISTLSGIYMAYRYARKRFLITGVFFAGAIVPVILLRF